jgi:archaellum component FlaC
MDSKRKNWVMTYGASSGYINFEMFRDEGSLEVDEVHSTSDGALVYTYFHLKTPVRQTTIKKFTNEMNKAHGFVLSDVFGYESVDGSTRGKPLTDHIAIQMLFKHMKDKNPAFVACTDGMPGVSRGILMECDELSRIREVLSKRAKLLVPVIDKFEQRYNDTKKKYEASSEQVDLLKEEIEDLKMRNEALRRKNRTLAQNYDGLKRGLDMIDRVIDGNFPPAGGAQ